MKRIIACCLVALLASSAASRPPPPRELPKYVCAVGGERFEQYGHTQNRVDEKGEQLSAPKAWLPIRFDIDEFNGFPECPTNGLPMYREFTPGELARLPALLKDREFRALRKDTPQPMRAHWLATELGDSAEAKLYLIVPALDLARSSAMRKRALLQIVAAFETSPFGASWHARYDIGEFLTEKIRFRLIYVHALRELGLFERALAELKSLPIKQLTGIVPKPILGPEEGEGDNRWRPTVNQSEIYDRSQDMVVFAEIAKIEKIVLRRDATANLFELLDEDKAVRKCEWDNEDKLAPSNRTYCMKPSILAKRKLYADEQEESLRRSQSGQDAVEEAARAMRCEVAKSVRVQIDKLPKPLSPEDQSNSSRIASELVACAAYDAM